MLSQGFQKKIARKSALWFVALVVLWLQPVAAQAQKELIVQFSTGGDDLRGGNDNVHLLVLLDTGAQVRFENINGLRRWANNSSVTVPRPFPADLGFHNIIGVRLETTFGGGIGGDNWNLDRLQVRARLGSETRVLLDQSGAPLFRFTGEQRIREFRFPVDLDQDGLPDGWEFTKSELGLSPLKANLILVPVIRPNMTREQVLPTLGMVRDFFARIPNRNPDGSTGIGLSIQWGNPLPDIDSDAPRRTPRDYREVRAQGIPEAWVGKGHGVLIGTGTGGGGQTSNSDWSGVSNNWHTIVHELGHQLGLDHAPRGSGIPSPLYASIMNYDYSYELNGDPNAVQFSPGRFRSVRLDESNLDETLPFAPADLAFLSQVPYRFELRSALLGMTHVDFNRNGIFGETGVRADVNGGTAVTARDRVDFKETAGGFTLTTFGGRLVAVYSDLRPPGGWIRYTQGGLSVSNPGGLKYQIYTGDRPGPALDLVSTGVTGDPHAVEAFGKLFVAFPTATGYSVFSYRQGSLADRLQIEGLARDTRGRPTHPVLIRTSGENLYVFTWDEVTKGVRYRKVNASATSSTISFGPAANLQTGPAGRTRPVLSNSPVGGAWDPTIGEIALVTTERSDRFQGRMKMIQLGRRGTGWHGQRDRWVMGTGSPVATLSRPTVLFDGRPSAGRTGQYLIYSRWEDNGSNPVLTELIRMTRGDTTDVWSLQLMQNVWTSTRSAPAAALYRDDIAWGWRVNESFPGVPNILQVFLRSSGVTDSGMTDFDDVSWIATQGLRESLQSVPL